MQHLAQWREAEGGTCCQKTEGLPPPVMHGAKNCRRFIRWSMGDTEAAGGRRTGEALFLWDWLLMQSSPRNQFTLRPLPVFRGQAGHGGGGEGWENSTLSCRPSCGKTLALSWASFLKPRCNEAFWKDGWLLAGLILSFTVQLFTCASFNSSRLCYSSENSRGATARPRACDVASCQWRKWNWPEFIPFIQIWSPNGLRLSELLSTCFLVFFFNYFFFHKVFRSFHVCEFV